MAIKAQLRPLASIVPVTLLEPWQAWQRANRHQQEQTVMLRIRLFLLIVLLEIAASGWLTFTVLTPHARDEKSVQLMKSSALPKPSCQINRCHQHKNVRLQKRYSDGRDRRQPASQSNQVRKRPCTNLQRHIGVETNRSDIMRAKCSQFLWKHEQDSHQMGPRNCFK